MTLVLLPCYYQVIIILHYSFKAEDKETSRYTTSQHDQQPLAKTNPKHLCWTSKEVDMFCSTEIMYCYHPDCNFDNREIICSFITKGTEQDMVSWIPCHCKVVRNRQTDGHSLVNCGFFLLFLLIKKKRKENTLWCSLLLKPSCQLHVLEHFVISP